MLCLCKLSVQIDSGCKISQALKSWSATHLGKYLNERITNQKPSGNSGAKSLNLSSFKSLICWKIESLSFSSRQNSDIFRPLKQIGTPTIPQPIGIFSSNAIPSKNSVSSKRFLSTREFCPGEDAEPYLAAVPFPGNPLPAGTLWKTGSGSWKHGNPWWSHPEFSPAGDWKLSQSNRTGKSKRPSPPAGASGSGGIDFSPDITPVPSIAAIAFVNIFPTWKSHASGKTGFPPLKPLKMTVHFMKSSWAVVTRLSWIMAESKK